MHVDASTRRKIGRKRSRKVGCGAMNPIYEI